jgi:MOSC domain-containing protein YiiM
VAELRDLTSRFPRSGSVRAIYVRPARNVPAVSVASVIALAGRGLAGDRSCEKEGAPRVGHKRQVTLMQAEHVPLIAGWVGQERIDPALFRRNLHFAGINLLAARKLFADQPILIAIGSDVVLVVTGPCDPCSKMEDALGPGAYNAMRGHGGLTAEIAAGGTIAVDDAVRVFAA